jgi:hypothetical protein
VSDHEDASDREEEEPTRYESEVPGHFFVKCPGCGTLLHLGRGWRGRETPLCPACDEADVYDWQEDPRVTMNKFLTLSVHEDEE